ncbi:MAG: ABC transporter permease [Ruminococcaceae bacterium]|nr:ABC transporter permease [Oscillospiraceae bacterium]
MQNVLNAMMTPSFGYAILRMTTPILFATLAAVIASKAGVSNIGIEGIMMFSALAGVIFSGMTKSWVVGLLSALVVGVFLGLMIGFFALKLNTDIVLAGIAVNTLGGGGTIFFLFLASGDRGASNSITSEIVPKINIPLIKDIPILGEVLSGHSGLTYFAFVCVILVYVLLYKTPLGLKMRAVGENRDAADSVGVSVNKISYIALALSGLLAGLAGAFMSMGYMKGFTVNMAAGRGFIGLAAQAMGQGEPIGGMLASLLFGFANAIAINLQGAISLSPQIIQSFPYILVIVSLVFYSLSTRNRLKRIKRAAIESDKTEAKDNS